MRCTSPTRLHPWEVHKNMPTEYINMDNYPLGYLEVPCGKCLACRIGHSREWQLRLIQELYFWKDAVFTTLTYRDECLPKYYSLDKSDLQKFFKRLRHEVSPIRYYACGEYGEQYDRPHYHAIIFGLSVFRAMSLLPKVWTHGQFLKRSIGTVTPDSCRYVTGYIDTKLWGKEQAERYLQYDRVPPFQVCSQGLGLRYALSDERIEKCLYTFLGGVKHALPRYYVRKLNIDKNRLQAIGFKNMLEVFKEYDEKGFNLDEAFKDIEARRKSKALNLKSKLKVFYKPRKN